MTTHPPHTTTGQRQDAAKRRREYLRKKAEAYTLIIAGSVLTTSVLCVLSLIGVLAFSYNSTLDVGEAVIMLAMFIPFPIAIAFIGIKRIRLKIREADSIPYVPPVAEQIAALPAQVILVRGSDQPIAAPEELLRAARTSVSDPAEELLRAEAR